MNILTKLTVKNLKLNKKRTIGTIIGIILSVALICAVSGMITSFRATLIQNAINETGYYHVEFKDISKKDLEVFNQNRDIKDLYELYSIGYSKFAGNIKEDELPFISVYSLNKEDIDNLSYKIDEGRKPKSSKEIVVNKKFLLASNTKIGDTITLEVGSRVTNNGYKLDNSNPYHEDLEKLINTKTKTYTIVGTVSKYNWGSLYYALTTDEISDSIRAYISLKNPKNYNTSIKEMTYRNSKQDEEKNPYEYSLNNELLRWEIFKMSDSSINTIIRIAGVVIVIIIFTSVFCIRNSFAISTTEKMKMYGMLSSIGATKKQIKKSVLKEGLILGLIAIPLGILGGILADFILIKVVNFILGDYLFTNTEGLTFKITLLPVIVAIILGFITIYFSSITSAWKASKVSPIDNLRNINEIKISSKKLKTPKFISKIFGSGGVLAYKNLKRSKKKYRTTIISLAVSIFAFISMYAFINEGFKQSSMYYQDYKYNISIYSGNNINETAINAIKNLDNINNIYITYRTKNHNNIHITDMSKIQHKSLLESLPEDENGKKYLGMEIIALDDSTFKTYVKEIDGNYENLKTTGILSDEYKEYDEDKHKDYITKIYNYKVGEVINTTLDGLNTTFNIKIGAVTNIKPCGYEHTYYYGGHLIINKDYTSLDNLVLDKIMIDASDATKVSNDIKNLNLNLSYSNYEEQVKSEKSMVLVISIFLYGFITVITLIGVTNIFNTITSNMELRSKEFAMLKSIGMTKKEFNHMVNLETLFYSIKSLIYGTILGIIGSLFVHKAISGQTEFQYTLPTTAIIIAFIFVIIVVYIIMKYSIKKINKQNTIETIRKENI